MPDAKETYTRIRSFESDAVDEGMLYKTLIEHTGTAIILVENDMTVSFANRKFCELTGYEKEKIEDKVTFLHFIHPDDSARLASYHAMRRQAFGSAPRQYEGRFINHAREVLYFLNTVVFLPQTKQSIASFIDITALKTKEKESLERLEMIEQQSRALEQKNITLQQVLEHIQKEKEDSVRATKETLQKLVLPHVLALKEEFPDGEIPARLDLLAATITEFESSLRLNEKTLTRTLSIKELQICHLIKQNYSTAAIADRLNVSALTVETHRKHIRKKLGLTNAAINLQTYLLTV